MEDWKIYLITFGSLFILNVISLVLALKFHPDFFPNNIWKKIGFIIYFLICGVTYWIATGLGELMSLLRSK